MEPEDVVIVPYQDGPYLVRGPVHLRDQGGAAIALTRRPIALCRCGKSRMRPFCDGTHQQIRFRAPSHPEQTAGSAGLPGGAGHLRSSGGTAHAQRSPDTQRSADAQRSGATRALSRARQQARLILRDPPSGGAEVAVRGAEPLIAGAITLLETLDPLDDDAGRLAPVGVLVQRAAELVSGGAVGPRDRLRELVAELSAAIHELERST